VAPAVQSRIATPDLATHASVSIARAGFPASESHEHRAQFSAEAILNANDGFRSRDENVYYNLHWEDVHAVNVVRRAGPIFELPNAPAIELPALQVKAPWGVTSLAELVEDERSRVQGLIVTRRGEVIYERYPGMRDNDNHIWFSMSKTLPSTLLAILEAQGRLDVSKPVADFLPAAADTAWSAIPVIDVLDMASGLDVAETPDTMLTRDHKVSKHFRLSLGGDAIPRSEIDAGNWTSADLVLAMDRKPGGRSGQVFEYSSINTQLLVMLVEQITGARFAEVLSEYVWSVIGAEGDALMGVSREGEALSGGMMNSRLRDLARYGMLFTPAGRRAFGARAARAWGLPSQPDLAERMRESCRPSLHQAACELGGGYFNRPTDPDVVGNSWQWDVVYGDGDMFKGGVAGQGLYVSPSRDMVVALFSTGYTGWLELARAIALANLSNGGEPRNEEE
jgi:CubicO group peptidase (beta-lactamase class C family)